jgi:hypothetical protein
MGFFVSLSHVVKQVLWLLAQPANILIHSDSEFIPRQLSALPLGLMLAFVYYLLGFLLIYFMQGTTLQSHKQLAERHAHLSIVSSISTPMLPNPSGKNSIHCKTFCYWLMFMLAHIVDSEECVTPTVVNIYVGNALCL